MNLVYILTQHEGDCPNTQISIHFRGESPLMPSRFLNEARSISNDSLITNEEVG